MKIELSKECTEAIMKQWEITASQMTNGVNPHAYLLGARSAITNPSIYEKAGLVKKEEYPMDIIYQYQPLFNAIFDSGGTPLESEMQEIIRIVHRDFPQHKEEKLDKALPESSNPVMEFQHSYCGSVDLLRVIYIEYHDGKPHAAIAEHNGHIMNFDFEPDCKEIEMFMYYNSGSGGSIKKIQAPHYADDYKGATYWMHKDAKFKGKPINTIRLDIPIAYDGNPNPFDIAREIYGTNYCKICDKYYDEDCCPDHHEYNDNGELMYIDGTKAD